MFDAEIELGCAAPPSSLKEMHQMDSRPTVILTTNLF
jgi:hypothetical protein